MPKSRSLQCTKWTLFKGIFAVVFVVSQGLYAGGSKGPDDKKEVIPPNWMSVRIDDASLDQLRQNVDALIAKETPTVGDCVFEKVEPMKEIVQGSPEVIETKGLLITAVRNFRYRSESRRFELPQFNNHAFSVIPSEDGVFEYWSANYFVYESVAGASHAEVREHKWFASIRAEDRTIVEVSYLVYQGLERKRKIEEIRCVESLN